MYFLAKTLGFGYTELMNMERCEMIKWIEVAVEGGKEEEEAYKKIIGGK